MKDRKLAVRYARALFAAFPDPAQNEPTARFLISVAKTLDEDRALRDRMLDPAIPRAKRIAAFTSLAKQAGLPEGVSNFLTVIVNNNRIAALTAIAAVFEEMREEALGIVPAEITTAGPLSDQERTRAQSAVQKLTGRQVRLTCKVEPKMIGGAVTRIGSTIYDGSLRFQLAQLKRRMAQE
jgi:F-type H+-transporting ATPase subunit delta